MGAHAIGKRYRCAQWVHMVGVPAKMAHSYKIYNSAHINAFCVIYDCASIKEKADSSLFTGCIHASIGFNM